MGWKAAGLQAQPSRREHAKVLQVEKTGVEVVRSASSQRKCSMTADVGDHRMSPVSRLRGRVRTRFWSRWDVFVCISVALLSARCSKSLRTAAVQWTAGSVNAPAPAALPERGVAGCCLVGELACFNPAAGPALLLQQLCRQPFSIFPCRSDETMLKPKFLSDECWLQHEAVAAVTFFSKVL